MSISLKQAYLSGVHRALNDVEDGDVTALSGVGGHHDVLGLGQSAVEGVRNMDVSGL